jgi:hypothetical protein
VGGFTLEKFFLPLEVMNVTPCNTSDPRLCGLYHEITIDRIRAHLKCAPIGWKRDDYDVLEDGVVVGRILKVPVAPQDRPWMWASGHNGEIRRAAHGYEPTRGAAMAAFANSWRRE